MINHKNKLRTTYVFFIFLILYGIVLVNLAITQLFQGDFFSSLGRKQYGMMVTVPAARGEIIDRHGNPLASNKESIAAFIMPKKVEDLDAVKEFLKVHFKEAYERFLAQAKRNFFYVKRRLSDDEVALISESNISDIKLLKEPSRYYPYPALAPVVGITNIDNKGLFGVEKLFDDQLSGQSTTVLLERDARSGLFYFSREYKDSGVSSQPVQLTLDADLQFLVHEALKQSVEEFHAESGSIVVVDPQTGEILVMANFPDFDPHEVHEEDMEFMKNKIITDVFEFGSVMKALVALAALEEGVVTPDEIIDCENTLSTTINGIPVTTTIAQGSVPFKEVIAQSNNIGMAKVALRLGPRLYDHYKKLGFGSRLGPAFLSEQVGFITPPHKWSKQSILSLSYGYEVSANLLQLARAFCIIARGGASVDLHYIKDFREPGRIERLYSEDSVFEVQKMLQKTVEFGTAQKAYVHGYDIMGKTGSADFFINGHYDKTRSIFSFAGIVQRGSYQRVIVTFIKNVSRRRLYASSVTAPLFKKVLEIMLIHDKEV